jgi:ankyrin repeat protein
MNKFKKIVLIAVFAVTTTVMTPGFTMENEQLNAQTYATPPVVTEITAEEMATHQVALLHACSHPCYIIQVENLLKIPGINVNYQTNEMFSPLLEACHFDNFPAFELLLSRNDIDVNIVHPIFYVGTPLHSVSDNGRLRMTELLLGRNDIDVDIVNADGETPLQIAQRTSYNNDLATLFEKRVKRIAHESDAS